MHSHISKTPLLIRFNLNSSSLSIRASFIPSSKLSNRVILLTHVALNLVVVRDTSSKMLICTQHNRDYFAESFYNLPLHIFCPV